MTIPENTPQGPQPDIAPAPNRSTKMSRRGMNRRKPARSADGSMTIVEHIEELRRRVMVSLLAIGIGTVLGYLWYATPVGPIHSLGDILKAPYCSLPPEARFGGSNGECRLLATSPFEMFLLRLKVGALAGFVLSSPIWLGQIWAFITPGLKKNERRWTFLVSLAAGTLFVVGAILAYLVLSKGLEFLLTIGDDAQIAALNGHEYFSFAISLLLIFGVSFELPLLMVMLNFAGVLTYEQLKDKRRYIIVALFVFAAFITPGQDPYSMVILAVALCVMVEIATQITRVNDKRRAAREDKWSHLDDAEASTIERAQPLSAGAEQGTFAASAEPVAPSPIAAPESVGGGGYEVSAAPAPRSGSGARPISQPMDNYGRREGLDLSRGAQQAANGARGGVSGTSADGQSTQAPQAGQPSPQTPPSHTSPTTNNPAPDDFFGDVL